jgi:hypothetical protein
MGRLPPEILDMIFGHTLDAEYIVHYDDKDGRLEDDRGITTFKRYKLSCHGFEAFPVLAAPLNRILANGPHDLHDKQVSPLFDTGCVSQPFVVSISHFLLHDRASLEVKAVARLDDVLKINSIALPRSMRLHYYQKDYTEWQAIMKSLSVMQPMLQRRIRPHTTVELALHMKPATCASFLKDMAPDLFALKDMGVSINVIHALNVRGPSNRIKKHGEIREHDLTWLFRSDLKSFEQNIRVNGKTRNTLVSGSCQCGRRGCTDVIGRRVWASR